MPDRNWSSTVSVPDEYSPEVPKYKSPVYRLRCLFRGACPPEQISATIPPDAQFREEAIG